FLNCEEDYARYQSYKERLPERQQLEGLRSAMASNEVPLDETTEEQLVDAMYRAGTQPQVTDFNGAAGMEALARGNMVEEFQKSWELQQEALRIELNAILDEKQREAFFEHQEQMKEFQLMSIKMAEKMM